MVAGSASPAPARIRSRRPGTVNPGPRYDAIGVEYAAVATRQLVFGLHVHIAIRGADRALAVYNAMRSHLPCSAAFAANAPFYEGPTAASRRCARASTS